MSNTQPFYGGFITRYRRGPDEGWGLRIEFPSSGKDLALAWDEAEWLARALVFALTGEHGEGEIVEAVRGDLDEHLERIKKLEAVVFGRRG